MANLNLLFTCPHGGKDVLPNQSLLRKSANYPSSCKECEKFELDSDLCTMELTESIATNIVNFTGKQVYTQIAQTNRDYIDFNREIECAIEPSNDKTAENMYLDYHKRILKIIQQMPYQNERGSTFSI